MFGDAKQEDERKRLEEIVDPRQGLLCRVCELLVLEEGGGEDDADDAPHEHHDVQGDDPA